MKQLKFINALKKVVKDEKKMISEASVITGLKKALDDLKVEYSSILLFGSRAKNDFKKESDWDFLIIIKKKMDLKDQYSLRYEIF